MKNLLKTLEEKRPSFSKRQRAITDYILSHYEKAAYMTAGVLAAEASVSESTVVRFAIELGFDGYPEFRTALQEYVRVKLNSVERLELTASRFSEGDILDGVLASDAEKIRYTMENIDREAFRRAVRKMREAKTVYIVGVRSASTLANAFYYNLRMMTDRVRFVGTPDGSEMIQEIMGISEGDVLFAISFPRYSGRIRRAVAYAADRGANVISLTDSPDSPIAARADELLIAKSDMLAFVDSLVAPMSILNALTVALAKETKDELTPRLERLEAIWAQNDVYARSADGDEN